MEEQEKTSTAGKASGLPRALSEIPPLLEACRGQPDATLKAQIDAFLRGHDFAGTEQAEVFALLDALLFSDLTPLAGELAPRLDLAGYRLNSQPFHSMQRNDGKRLPTLFDVVPALIEAGTDPHETRSGLCLADWLTEYAFDYHAAGDWTRPRHSAALALMDYAPSLAAVRRPEKFLYQLAHLGGERAIRQTLARTGWDIDSSFDTPLAVGYTNGRPALGLATGSWDLPAVKCLLACGASPTVQVFDYRRTQQMVPLVEYAAHYPQEIKAALEGAFLDRQRNPLPSTDAPLGL
ncbi:MAG TPA: hypothetical protein VGB35_11740 [Gammaproteobacteria bacterium]|jgi:hypothetical protein